MGYQNKMLTPGDLRRRVTLEQLTATPDGSGGVTSTWTTLATVWAKVDPKSGTEKLHGDQLTPTITYDVTIRYRNDVDASMRVLYEGRTLRIIAVIDIGELHRFLTLTCDEWPAAAN